MNTSRSSPRSSRSMPVCLYQSRSRREYLPQAGLMPRKNDLRTLHRPTIDGKIDGKFQAGKRESTITSAYGALRFPLGLFPRCLVFLVRKDSRSSASALLLARYSGSFSLANFNEWHIITTLLSTESTRYFSCRRCNFSRVR